MPKLLVLFHSRTGNTAAVAEALAAGARTVRFTEVDVRRLAPLAPDLSPHTATDTAPDIARPPTRGPGDGGGVEAASAEAGERLRARFRTLEDVEQLANYDALALGGPTRGGGVSAEVRMLLDQATTLAPRGALLDRVGCAFTAATADDAGQELALWSMMIPMAHLGMIIVPPGPATTSAEQGSGAPYGAIAAGSSGSAALALAHRQGVRLARVAEWVRHAKGHETGDGGGHHHHHH